MNGMLDLNKKFVQVGKYSIQGSHFFGLPPGADQDEGRDWANTWRGRLKFLALELGLVYDESRSGKQQGYGHGYETLTLANQDGSLIFQMRHVNHCDGPGYACSYSHGPWYTYGEYKGDVAPDEELMQAIKAKELLKKKFVF